LVARQRHLCFELMTCFYSDLSSARLVSLTDYSAVVAQSIYLVAKLV